MFQHGKIIMMTNDLDDQRFKIIEMAKVIEIIEMTGVFTGRGVQNDRDDQALVQGDQNDRDDEGDQ